MGNCVKPETENDEYFNSTRFLLLGAGESGKSNKLIFKFFFIGTFFKQIKMLYESGYTQKEYDNFKESIFTNIVQSMKALLTACHKFKIPFEDEETRKISEKIDALNEQDLSNIIGIYTVEFGKELQLLWSSESIQKVLSISSQFQLLDSTN
jgi:guanine nucleotide-binding protein G(i) subunit alpha